jgi:D-aminoacyl-tRNA deacylase
MRVVIQRVSRASVKIDGAVCGAIGHGMLLLLGIEEADTEEDVQWLCQKLTALRIFSDSEGKMNLCVGDVAGDFLVVSQFTLHASYKKGNRPSFIHAARPEQAIPLYDHFNRELATVSGRTVATGVFGAMMEVELVNDGPVTIIMDTKNKT